VIFDKSFWWILLEQYWKMAKLGFVIDSPLFDLSSPSAQQRTTSVPLSGKVVLTVDKPTQIKAISLKYECINSHIDLEVSIPYKR